MPKPKDTTSKPKAFQFIEGRPAVVQRSQHAEKENIFTAEYVKSRNNSQAKPSLGRLSPKLPPLSPQKPTPGRSSQKPPPTSPHKPTPKRSSQKPTPRRSYQKPPPISPQKSFPSTPATRLPLADLIGNTDETNDENQTTDVSPEDHIAWRPAKNTQSSNPSTTPGPKGKKRARSSSPPTSSLRESKHFNAGKDALDLRKLKQLLKTPQVDPAADLWNRYSISTSRDGPLGIQTAAFANLLNSLSPGSANDQASNVSGLRRWRSCGMEWPSSKAKRRKFQPSAIKEHIEDVFADISQATKQDSDHAELKTSRIESLLERIQQSLANPAEEQEPKAPSSSSPLPERGDRSDRQSISPCRSHELAVRPADDVEALDGTTSDEAANDEAGLADHKQSNTSSFGSDDIDFEAIEVAKNARTGPDTVNDETTQAFRHAPAEPVGSANRAVARNELHVVSERLDVILDEDEFGDDEELSMTDFEAVGSFFDQRDTAAQNVKRSGYTHCPTTVNNAAIAPFDGIRDEFEDDDIDDASFVAAEVAATQSVRASGAQKSSTRSKDRAIQRYCVTNVFEGDYTTVKGQRRPEKVLLVEDDKTKLNKTITLRQSWFDTHCTRGSYVHVIGDFSATGECFIDDSQNMLILHPDHLISALVVADSFSCIRRAVLQDRIKATSESSPPMVYGTMLHEIFQEALTVNRWDDDCLRKIIHTIVDRHIEDLYGINLTTEQAADHLQSKMTELQAWAKVFVKFRPEANAIVKDRKGKQVLMSINKLLDVEEHIWSPMYGLKGNIDATVQIAMQDDEGERILTVPFEVKTGKNPNASHRAQTALYTLLLSDRYDVAIAYGILYYLETSEVSRIPAIRREIQHMVMQRNELACYVRERLSLPPMLKNPHMCGRCYAKTSCFVYHKLAEDGNGETSGMKEKFVETCRHLKPAHQEFFKKWDDLLTKEESEMMKFRRELWTMLSKDREKLGRCFANVILEPGSASEEQGGSKINRFRYTFRKHLEIAIFSFTDSQITVGEPIVISDEKGHYALAKGYVTNVQKHRIAVAVDRRLHNARIRKAGFDSETNQSFAGIMEIEMPEQVMDDTPHTQEPAPMLYRLDKDEFSNGMATVRNNLVQIMTDTVINNSKVRNLVVDRVEPRFKPTSTAYTLSGPLSQMTINDDQKAAIEKVMTAEDYALVLGMPGTGKTSTIAHIIRALVAQGKSVLLASYTHTAVDNILLKIRHDHIGILRLGAVAKVHPEVREFVVLAGEPRATIEELYKAYHEPKAVATTCLGINHQIFNERTFDYCIVDEASQITLPVCLGPIRMAKAFVLVGDHYQLPPLVQNREAQDGGLDVSLFKLLSESHPSAVVTLQHQYRMNSAIMSISNTLIYSGRLKCGSESVANRILELPNFSALKHLHHPQSTSITTRTTCASHSSRNCWLHQTLSPSSPPVIFLNTDTLLPTSLEKLNGHGARITNPLEATLITQLVRALLFTGMSATAIGVITLYRSQLALIKSQLHSAEYGLAQNQAEQVEAHTTDRFQGRDKDVVLLSCVRSNERNVVGELLKDWRRVNVAVTRARRKLVIVGSKGTLGRGDELLGKLVGLCEREGWVVDLPLDAADEGAHVWAADGGVASVVLARKEVDEAYSITTQKQAVRAPATRAPLQPRTANNPAFKVPRKVGKITGNVVLGSANVRHKRPVFADLVNEVVGEDFLD